MATGIESVEEGVDRSRVAGTALEVILSAAAGLLSNARQYLDISRHIETAMDEQKATARYIMDKSQFITDLIARIQENTASHEQASGKVAERFESLLEGAQEIANLIQALGGGLHQRDGDDTP
jgi:methyl-accepting chemotaxis protein